MSVLLFGVPALSYADETVETLYNPLAKTVSSDKPVQSIAKIIINALFGVTGSVALVMFVYGGFLWVTSAGNSKRVGEGKQVFIWSTLGIVMMFSSYVIVNFLFTNIAGSGAVVPTAADDFVGPPTSAAGGDLFCCANPSLNIATQSTITSSDFMTAIPVCTKKDAKAVPVPGTCKDLVYCVDDGCKVKEKSKCDPIYRAYDINSCAKIDPSSDAICTGKCMEKTDCTTGKTEAGKCTGGANRICCIPK
jgi:hypothetical protein